MQQVSIWHAFGDHQFTVSSEPGPVPRIAVRPSTVDGYVEDAQNLYKILSENLPSGTWERFCELVRLEEDV